MRKKSIITLVVLSFTICFIYLLPNGTFSIFLKQYKLYNKECYNINVGETFEINLNQNGSTGYTNCWLNKNEIDIVEEINSEYVSDSEDKQIAGAGGVLTIMFKGVKKGCDTIKFSNCPAYIERKKCEEYTSKNTEVDDMFIINVD